MGGTRGKGAKECKAVKMHHMFVHHHIYSITFAHIKTPSISFLMVKIHNNNNNNNDNDNNNNLKRDTKKKLKKKQQRRRSNKMKKTKIDKNEGEKKKIK